MDFALSKKHEMARTLFRDFAEAEVKSLDRLREQRKLYEQAKQMFEQIQERKNLLEEIEQKTSEYEKILRNYNNT